MKPEAFLPSQVCTTLMRLGTRMATIFDQHFAQMNLTQAQFRTLLAIYEQGAETGIAPSDLAGFLLLDRATITLLSNRLVERGLLERRPGENRRTFLLALTAEGRETLERVLPRATALADETLDAVPSSDLARLQHLLDQVEGCVRGLDLAELGSRANTRATSYRKDTE